jgi:ankyrin repeat protein
MVTRRLLVTRPAGTTRLLRVGLVVLWVAGSAGSVVGQVSFVNEPTLHDLAARGEPARIAQAIAKGASVDVRDPTGRTPLHVAAKEAHLFATMMLIAKGADVRACDQDRRTPLHMAAAGDPAADGERYQIVKLLVAKGADRAAVDAAGKRPVDYATRAEIRKALEP